MFVPVILGTAREGRQSEKAAGFMLQEAAKFGLESEMIDVRDYRVEATDNSGKSLQARKFAEKINKSDAIIIVSPEYNHGYPGELKMTLDLLYEEYKGKPIGVCGVSIGSFGGVRAVEQLRLVAVELRMISIRESLCFPLVSKLFDENGNMTDNSYYERSKSFFGELIDIAKKVKS